MAANGYAVNQAAVNSGYNIVQFGAAAITAVAAITADITYVHVTTSNAPSTATLESYVWQLHNVPFSAKAKATATSTPWVQKWETANFSADAEISSYILAVGANGIFNASASIQPDITYKWASSATFSALSTGVVDEFQSNRATSFPKGTATFYPEGMLKLNGESVYTHDGSAKPTILGEANFANIQTIIKPDGWYAPGTAGFSATGRFKRFIRSTSTARALFYGGVIYVFRDILNLTPTATMTATAKVTGAMNASLATVGALTNAFATSRQVITSTMTAPATVSAPAFVKRFGTYPVFNGIASAQGDTIINHAVTTNAEAFGNVFPTSFQWHFHDDGASDMSAQAAMNAPGFILKGQDAVTFIRPAETKDFTRPSETKDFIRVAT